MATLSPYIFNQYFDNNGAPTSGGMVFAYEAGTLVFKDTFADAEGTILNANPFILNSAGRGIFFLESGAYDFVIQDSLGNILETVDKVIGDVGSASFDAQSVDNSVALKALVEGSSDYVLMGGRNTVGDKGGGFFYWDALSTETENGGTIFIPNSLPGAGRWIRLFSGPVNLKWFGAVSDYTGNGAGTDNTSTINDCLAYARSVNLPVSIPEGAYLIKNFITCAVPLIGEKRGSVVTNELYGSNNWNPIVPEGAVFVWDKSTLTASDIYLRNNSGDFAGDVVFENMTFLSLSSGGVGGGNLLVNDSAQTGTEYNLGSQPNFKNCLFLNLNTVIKVNLYNGWTIQDAQFRGCLQPLSFGDGTELAENINLVNVEFTRCGSLASPFINLDNVSNIVAERCRFNETSDIQIRVGRNNAITFLACYVNDASLNAGGDFITVSSVAGFNVENVSFINCTGGNAGDINLIQGANFSTLFIENSVLVGAQIPLGTNNVILTEVGLVTTGGTTGTGVINRFTAAEFQARGIKLDSTGSQRQITTLTPSGTDDESIQLNGGGDEGNSRGGNVEVFGDDHATTPGDVNINGATGGASEGDINLNPGTGKNVNLSQDLNLLSGAGINIPLGGGLSIAGGADATAGVSTLSGTSLTVNTNKVQTGSIILLTYRNATLTAGLAIAVSSIVNGVSFTVFGETGEEFSWLIINPL